MTHHRGPDEPGDEPQDNTVEAQPDESPSKGPKVAAWLFKINAWDAVGAEAQPTAPTIDQALAVITVALEGAFPGMTFTGSGERTDRD